MLKPDSYILACKTQKELIIFEKLSTTYSQFTVLWSLNLRCSISKYSTPQIPSLSHSDGDLISIMMQLIVESEFVLRIVGFALIGFDDERLILSQTYYLVLATTLILMKRICCICMCITGCKQQVESFTILYSIHLLSLLIFIQYFFS